MFFIPSTCRNCFTLFDVLRIVHLFQIEICLFKCFHHAWVVCIEQVAHVVKICFWLLTLFQVASFFFYQLSQVFFTFCKWLLQVAVRCCELFLELITLLGLSKLFQVGFGLFYVAWVLQVVSSCLICVGSRLLQSLSSCVDRENWLRPTLANRLWPHLFADFGQTDFGQKI